MHDGTEDKSLVKEKQPIESVGDKKRIPELRYMNRKQRREYYKNNHKRAGFPNWALVNGSDV